MAICFDDLGSEVVHEWILGYSLSHGLLLLPHYLHTYLHTTNSSLVGTSSRRETNSLFSIHDFKVLMYYIYKDYIPSFSGTSARHCV